MVSATVAIKFLQYTKGTSLISSLPLSREKVKSTPFSLEVVSCNVLCHCSLFVFTSNTDTQPLQPSVLYSNMVLISWVYIPSHYPQFTLRKSKICFHGEGMVCGNGDGQSRLTKQLLPRFLGYCQDLSMKLSRSLLNPTTGESVKLTDL